MTLHIYDSDRLEVMQLLFHLDKVENSDGSYTIADEDEATVREVLEEAEKIFVIQHFRNGWI
jgi:hypothetical protein